VGPKDTTLDYARRRGLEPAAEPLHKPEEHQASRREERDPDPVDRFKQAQRESIKVAGNYDLDSKAKTRGGVAARDEICPQRKSRKAQI
jgi:hypothetical protein